jgi:hypothetical protein
MPCRNEQSGSIRRSARECVKRARDKKYGYRQPRMSQGKPVNGNVALKTGRRLQRARQEDVRVERYER